MVERYLTKERFLSWEESYPVFANMHTNHPSGELTPPHYSEDSPTCQASGENAYNTTTEEYLGLQGTKTYSSYNCPITISITE